MNPWLAVLWVLLGIFVLAFLAAMVLGLSEKNEILSFLGIGMGGILLAIQAVIANRWVKANPGLAFLWVLLFIFVLASLFVMFSEDCEAWIGQLLGLSEKNEILSFLGIGMGGILLTIQAVIANRRAKAMEEQAKAQVTATENQAAANRQTERGQRQERLKLGIEHLGHGSYSVRLGGAYELFHLAQDTEELRQTVLDILCAHLRRTTRERYYRTQYPDKPSEEVQSLLTLMFVEEHTVFEGRRINLQGSWLNGARLWKARLQEANLADAHLDRAELAQAQLQGSALRKACLNGAGLVDAHLHGADLAEVQGICSDLHRAHLHGANLRYANLQGADLSEASLQGSMLDFAHLEVATLVSASLQGTSLIFTSLQGAALGGANLGGATATPRAFYKHMSFPERIRNQIGELPVFTRVDFEGGLTQEGVESIVHIVQVWSDENAKKSRRKLNPHVNNPDSSNQLPENSSANTEPYSSEDAEKWIAEYENAMSKDKDRSTHVKSEPVDP